MFRNLGLDPSKLQVSLPAAYLWATAARASSSWVRLPLESPKSVEGGRSLDLPQPFGHFLVSVYQTYLMLLR